MQPTMRLSLNLRPLEGNGSGHGTLIARGDRAELTLWTTTPPGDAHLVAQWTRPPRTHVLAVHTAGGWPTVQLRGPGWPTALWVFCDGQPWLGCVLPGMDTAFQDAQSLLWEHQRSTAQSTVVRQDHQAADEAAIQVKKAPAPAVDPVAEVKERSTAAPSEAAGANRPETVNTQETAGALAAEPADSSHSGQMDEVFSALETACHGGTEGASQRAGEDAQETLRYDDDVDTSQGTAKDESMPVLAPEDGLQPSRPAACTGDERNPDTDAPAARWAPLWPAEPPKLTTIAAWLDEMEPVQPFAGRWPGARFGQVRPGGGPAYLVGHIPLEDGRSLYLTGIRAERGWRPPMHLANFNHYLPVTQGEGYWIYYLPSDTDHA